ncbi:hypothetical protein RRG08_048366 [Elysia crispata]|uniref:Protein amnionless n=1 Tax=Elysia crispata TaxID=231223 RepID=A0AAE1EBR6_9GAST|nr:hypothetical protein RRG08_048366 [Elysia crispata]
MCCHALRQKDVKNIIAVMTGDWVQLVLTDTTGEKSKKLAYSIRDDLDKDKSAGGHKYAIDSYQLFMDTIASHPNANGSRSSLSGGSIAGIILGIFIFLIIVAAIVVIFVYRRTGRPLPSLPSMPSLDSVPGLSRIPGLRGRRVTARTGSGTPRTAAHVDPGFANPMYDNSPLDDDFVVREMEMVGSIQEEQPTFESSSNKGFQNPLYGKDGGFKDPTKVDTPGDEATTSGLAITPSSGASPGPTAKETSGRRGKKAGATPASTAADASGMILDFSDTDALNTDSTI